MYIVWGLASSEGLNLASSLLRCLIISDHLNKKHLFTFSTRYTELPVHFIYLGHLQLHLSVWVLFHADSFYHLDVNVILLFIN